MILSWRDIALAESAVLSPERTSTSAEQVVLSAERTSTSAELA
ncbi:hypothetical protein BN988_01375 [Oceanobacillus picturae]|uniref:Uncharacterized protein n=1 Tax=Oceanobacillus picturae TaxID=171693 RepID=W9B8K0_9BACI|nr:hypothetical protein BN988_01375 [Oceanobacillus picturae]